MHITCKILQLINYIIRKMIITSLQNGKSVNKHFVSQENFLLLFSGGNGQILISIIIMHNAKYPTSLLLMAKIPQ